MEHKKQQNLRRHAAENFFKSFEQQLFETFQDSNSEAEKSQPQPQNDPFQSSPPDANQSISLSELEEAIADIDDYLQNQQSENPESQE